ncbi:MAG TPA: hypothetical protein DEQ25_09990 [Methylophaga sp.]|nr:hypothetical protein [Methylophaga sp.]
MYGIAHNTQKKQFFNFASFVRKRTYGARFNLYAEKNFIGGPAIMNTKSTLSDFCLLLKTFLAGDSAKLFDDKLRNG